MEVEWCISGGFKKKLEEIFFKITHFSSEIYLSGEKPSIFYLQNHLMNQSFWNLGVSKAFHRIFSQFISRFTDLQKKVFSRWLNAEDYFGLDFLGFVENGIDNGGEFSNIFESLCVQKVRLLEVHSWLLAT